MKKKPTKQIFPILLEHATLTHRLGFIHFSDLEYINLSTLPKGAYTITFYDTFSAERVEQYVKLIPGYTASLAANTKDFKLQFPSKGRTKPFPAVVGTFSI
jgi:hypothetical protein